MSGSGLGFLPLEKIPIFVWGLILLALGGFLLFKDDFLSWGQINAGLIAVAGMCAVIYDVRKRFNSLEKGGEEK